MKSGFSRLVLGSLMLLALGVSASPPTGAEPPVSGAKDLFYKQLDQPKVAMNTGLQYWIELRRGDQVSIVSNKTAFKSGDNIRIHLRPNIDGYVYVLLKSGSRGERDILFPIQKLGDNNRITRGIAVSLPAPDKGYMQFDTHPGTEQVGIVLSRTPINPMDYLNTSQTVVIASGISGSKDLVPSRVVVQAPTQNATTSPGIGFTNVVASNTTPNISSSVVSVTEPGVTTTSVSTTSTSSTPPATTLTNSTADNGTSSSVSTTTSTTTTTTQIPANQPQPGVTTVVDKDAGTLGVDVALQHI